MSSSPVLAEARHASGGLLRSYVGGFLLSLLLTALSFGLVMAGRVPPGLTFGLITLLAVVQLLVQLVFFLHLGTAPDQRHNTVIFILTALLITTVVTGSLWVMHNANVNMMPMSPALENRSAGG